jgi:hypothetical protein
MNKPDLADKYLPVLACPGAALSGFRSLSAIIFHSTCYGFKKINDQIHRGQSEIILNDKK